MSAVICTKCRHMTEYSGEIETSGDSVKRLIHQTTWHTCPHCGRELERHEERNLLTGKTDVSIRLAGRSIETIDLKQFNPEMLKMARMLRGFNVQELAKLTGVTQKAIKSLEAGQIPMDGSDLRKLAIALEMPMVFFVREGKIETRNIWICYAPDYAEEPE